MTKEERLAHIERSLNVLDNTGGTDKDWMLKIIREQDAELASLRERVLFLLGMLAEARAAMDYTVDSSDQNYLIREWLAAYPAPKKTHACGDSNCIVPHPAPHKRPSPPRP